MARRSQAGVPEAGLTLSGSLPWCLPLESLGLGNSGRERGKLEVLTSQEEMSRPWFSFCDARSHHQTEVWKQKNKVNGKRRTSRGKSSGKEETTAEGCRTNEGLRKWDHGTGTRVVGEVPARSRRSRKATKHRAPRGLEGDAPPRGRRGGRGEAGPGSTAGG